MSGEKTLGASVVSQDVLDVPMKSHRHSSSKSGQSGFTLIELLVTLAVIASLSTILITIANPTEIFKKSRDEQRLSDLRALKTSIDSYISSTTEPELGNYYSGCFFPNTNAALIFYSYNGADMTCPDDVAEGGDVASGAAFSRTADFCFNITNVQQATSPNGSGWLPINFESIPGGTPLSKIPLDPSNTVANSAHPNSADYVYRYACQNQTSNEKPENVIELDAVLESQAYTQTDNKMSKDGGDNVNYYEVGSSLKLMGTGNNF